MPFAQGIPLYPQEFPNIQGCSYSCSPPAIMVDMQHFCGWFDVGIRTDCSRTARRFPILPAISCLAMSWIGRRY